MLCGLSNSMHAGLCVRLLHMPLPCHIPRPACWGCFRKPYPANTSSTAMQPDNCIVTDRGTQVAKYLRTRLRTQRDNLPPVGKLQTSWPHDRAPLSSGAGNIHDRCLHTRRTPRLHIQQVILRPRSSPRRPSSAEPSTTSHGRSPRLPSLCAANPKPIAS